MAERVMTCEEAAPLLDAFVDAELEGATLIDVARHAASCRACDGTLQERIALHKTLGRHGRADADSVDLSGLWTALEPQLAQADARRAWRRRLRSAPVWGGALAIAASALFTSLPCRLRYRAAICSFSGCVASQPSPWRNSFSTSSWLTQ